MNLQQRKTEMIRLRLSEKWSLQAIGKRFGLTKQRVQQIMAKAGVRFNVQTIESKKRKDIWRANKSLSNSKLAELMGITEDRVCDYREGERHEIKGGWM